MKILAISGSLRARSLNSVLLRAANAVASEGIEIVLSEHLKSLPLYNPDFDGALCPREVLNFRALLSPLANPSSASQRVFHWND